MSPQKPLFQISDPYWTPRLETNARRAIFHQWEQLEASGCIDNFRILAGEKEGFREGWFFADSDAYKWLEAAARIYAARPDPALADLMDGFIGLLARAQAPDGYLYTYNQIHFPDMRWANLQIEHELYCHGHLIEAGVSHQAATGRDDLLAVARTAADLLVEVFLHKGPEYTPGHEEVEIALLRLYEVTGREAYLDLAEQFITRRGRAGPLFGLQIARQNAAVDRRGEQVTGRRREYLSAHPEHGAFELPPGNTARRPPGIQLRWTLSALSGQYFQQHTPLRKQREPVGHAVRFAYLQTAAAHLQRLRPDADLLSALERTWTWMVARRMYVTGGIGSLPTLEGFGRDGELDPEYAYAETCAALGSMFWNWEMALLTRQAQYSDLFEWQLYNAAAVGMGLGGESYLYNNPLACRGGVTRKAWYAVPCCPSNLSRTWADLGRYLVSAEPGQIWVHQYVGGQVDPDPGTPVRLHLESGMPWSGGARLQVEIRKPADFSLHLRIPSWTANRARARLNGEELETPSAPRPAHPAWGGFDPRRARFLTIRRMWQPGDRVELEFDMVVAIRLADPRVRGHAGKAAVTHGPLVYCLESVDNPGVDLFSVRLDPASLEAEFDPGLLGGTTVLHGRSPEGQALMFIPYHLWANRGPSEMVVWVQTEGKG